MLIKGDPRTRQISQLGGQTYKERRERLRPVKIKEQDKRVLGAHVRHGGRDDLGPSTVIQLPHVGDSKCES